LSFQKRVDPPSPNLVVVIPRKMGVSLKISLHKKDPQRFMAWGTFQHNMNSIKGAPMVYQSYYRIYANISEVSPDSVTLGSKYIVLPYFLAHKLSTPGFLSLDDYYARHRNPRNIVFARHNRLISQNIIHYNT
jgi:hypothetical protein